MYGREDNKHHLPSDFPVSLSSPGRLESIRKLEPRGTSSPSERGRSRHLPATAASCVCCEGCLRASTSCMVHVSCSHCMALIARPRSRERVAQSGGLGSPCTPSAACISRPWACRAAPPVLAGEAYEQGARYLRRWRPQDGIGKDGIIYILPPAPSGYLVLWGPVTAIQHH